MLAVFLLGFSSRWAPAGVVGRLPTHSRRRAVGCCRWPARACVALVFANIGALSYVRFVWSSWYLCRMLLYCVMRSCSRCSLSFVLSCAMWWWCSLSFVSWFSLSALYTLGIMGFIASHCIPRFCSVRWHPTMLFRASFVRELYEHRWREKVDAIPAPSSLSLFSSLVSMWRRTSQLPHACNPGSLYPISADERPMCAVLQSTPRLRG